ncbi:MAG: InlB B-repeat-containing protein, partial [Candidatus Methanomethylophilaceae archaeon]|nr:InlB B-repeat-containing protein [Candidatus Methanomethylophilaceae archaeon]
MAVVLILLTVSFTTDLGAESETFFVDGIEYEKSYGQSVWISGIRDSVSDLTIDHTITYESTDYVINGVNQFAFLNSELLTGTLTINCSLIINEGAFKGCTKLSSLSISNVILFEDCFSGCISLDSIVINSGVKMKGAPFKECNGLNSLEIYQNSFKDWIESPFKEIKSNHNVSLKLGDSITLLPELLFSGLDSIVLEDSGFGKNLQKLKNSYFLGCNIRLPNNILIINQNVDEIDRELLDRIQNLEKIDVNNENPHYYHKNGALYNIDTSSLEFLIRSTIGSFTIDYGTITIGDHSLNNCNQITELYFPNSIKNIPDGAFSNMSGLGHFYVNSPYYRDCNGILYSRDLSELIAYPSANPKIRYDVLPNVKVVDDYAFCRAKVLNEVILPDSVTSVGSYAFYECKSLSKIVFLSDVVELGVNSLDLKGNADVTPSCNLYLRRDLTIESSIGNTPIGSFEKCCPFYTISYYYDAESISPEYCDYYAEGDLVKVHAPMEIIVGTSFDYWYLNDQTQYSIGETFSMPKSNLNLFAKVHNIVYFVNYDSNGGIGDMLPSKHVYGEGPPLSSPLFTKIGHSIVGWNTSVDLNGEFYPLDYSDSTLCVEDNSNITLFAVWSIKQYTISFETGFSNSIDPIVQDYDTPIEHNPLLEREGYTFLQWSPAIPDRMPAENITCVAQWSINTYDITFDLAYGGKKIVRSYDYMASVSSENDPERTGYVFSKWDQAIPERMPAMDMTITAIWIANAYAIRFVSNGGDGSMLPMNATYDEGIELTVCSFEKTGYTFSGWTYTSGGSVSLSDGCEVRNLATGVEGDDEVILYAVWSANEYVVTFNSNDGKDREVSRTFTYDSDESLPIGLFTRIGHSFTGWAPSPSGEVIRTDGAKVDNLSTGATIGLYAIWSVNTYRINFVDTGDSVIEDIVALYGSDIIPPNDPVCKGYTFDDWDTDVPVMMPGYDMTITAKWIENTYSIRFMSNGGIGSISPLVATYDHDVELTVCSFERTGYSFTGWSMSVNGPVSFQDGSKVRNLATGADGDDIVILHAIWSANSYVVNFNSNYGENEKDSRTFVYDSDESLPKGLFTRVGHTLSGWALEPNGGKIRSDGAGVDNLSSGDEVELYAIWSVNTYRIHFIDTGDSTIDDIVGLYGSPITSPGDPICEGHSFAGWDPEIPETMPAMDLEIKAKWSVNTFRIHFANTGDSIIHDIVTIYGASITSPDDPVRKGYTFSDWNMWIPSTMPAKDLTIAAVWVANSYSIRFMPNGGNGTMSAMIA